VETSYERFKTNAPVILRVLDKPDDPRVEGRILEVSGRGVLVSAASPAPCGSLVRIEGEDTLLLGEVCSREPSGERWNLAVQVRHSLDGLAELARLNRALLCAESKREVEARVRR
jgi:hypothetical protein